MDPRLFSLKKLQREFREINERGEEPFTVGLEREGDFYRWTLLLEGPENSLFEGGLFEASMLFPPDYPLSPPRVVFKSPMWHPNVYPGGEVCISILHPPELDRFNEQETLEEKWRPVLGVREVVVSILSILMEPNTDSPANVDASVQFKNNYAAYRQKVRSLIDS